MCEAHIPLSNPTTRKDLPLTHEPHYLYTLLINTPLPMNLLLKDQTNLILRSFYDVYNNLGYGFLEKVYRNALIHELNLKGFSIESQKQIKVFYKNIEVGNYFPDIIVNDQIILELKAVASLHPEHECQLLNYLKATGITVGLLLNFGEKPQFIRKIYEKI